MNINDLYPWLRFPYKKVPVNICPACGRNYEADGGLKVSLTEGHSPICREAMRKKCQDSTS